MTGLPSVLYFPYIDLDPGTIKGLLCLFREVILLQPSFSVSASWTEEAEGRGLVKIHRPLCLDLDAKGARSLLREYERLGALYQDSGYLAYLKHGGAQRLGEEPGYELIREIKDYGQSSPASGAQETLRGQILLQMAQDLDRQRREIQAALGELQEQERSLQRNMGLGLEEDDDLDWGVEPLPTLEEDDFLIPQRLQAWGEMLDALLDSSPGLLLTDNLVVMENLLEWAAARSGNETSAFEKLLQISVPLFVPNNMGEVARIHQALSPILPWKIFYEKLEAYLNEVRTVSWTESSRRDSLAKGRALSAYFQDTVLDSVLESVAALEPSWREGWRQVSLEAVLLPEFTETELLKGPKGGPPTGGDHHAIVFHLGDSEGNDLS